MIYRPDYINALTPFTDTPIWRMFHLSTASWGIIGRCLTQLHSEGKGVIFC